MFLFFILKQKQFYYSNDAMWNAGLHGYMLWNDYEGQQFYVSTIP